MVLWIALASVFSVLLGYSRVPYSAALDGNFFPVFGRLHPTKHFPYVSLLVLGGLAFLFSVTLKLETAINGILAMRLLVQFIGQAVGVMLLRRRWGYGAIAFQDVALPAARGAYHVRLGLALLANRHREKMGNRRNRAGNARISYLGPENATMAVCKSAF